MARDRDSPWAVLAQKLTNAETDDFAELVEIAGLDPKRHLRFSDWSGVSFQGSDLRGFDFTGARLLNCEFAGALIAGARFDQAEIDRAGLSKLFPPTRLQDAGDWHKYVDLWHRVATLPPDDHLPIGAVFQDAPAAPELVVVLPAGQPHSEHEGPERERRQISTAKLFALGRQPVTVGQFIAFQEWKDRYGPSFMTVLGLDRAPPRGSWEYPGNESTHNQPIGGVNLDEATAYVKWLSHLTGMRYRLLSEDQFEYAKNKLEHPRYGMAGFRVGRTLRV